MKWFRIDQTLCQSLGKAFMQLGIRQQITVLINCSVIFMIWIKKIIQDGCQVAFELSD